MAWRAPSYYLNQCWNIVNWTLGNKNKWNINRNLYIFIQENAFENVFWKMAAILFRPQCVKVLNAYTKCGDTLLSPFRSFRCYTKNHARFLTHAFYTGEVVETIVCEQPLVILSRYDLFPARPWERKCVVKWTSIYFVWNSISKLWIILFLRFSPICGLVVFMIP